MASSPSLAEVDFYGVLQLNKNASQAEIKSAYKKQALKCHPDRVQPEKQEEATQQFKLVAKAYEVLSNPTSRQKYNYTSNPSGPFQSSPFSFDDNFAKDRSSSSGRSSEDRSQFFGSSPDVGPFSFTWESAADSARRAQNNTRGHKAGFPFNNPFELFNDMFKSEMNGMSSGLGGTGSASTFGQADPFLSDHSRMSAMGMGVGMGSMGNMGMGLGSSGLNGLGGMSGLAAADTMETSTTTSPSNSFFGSPRSFSAMPPAHGRRQGGQTSNQPSVSTSSGGVTYSSSSTSSSTSTYGFGSNSTSETRQTRSVNGRTETVVTKVDGEGQETVHVITPEKESVFVNGVKQSENLLQGSTQQARVGTGWS